MQLIGVDDQEDHLVGLSVTDSPSGSDVRRRVWVGRRDDGAASIALSDGAGKKRLLLQVTADGNASVSFLDANGKVVKQLP